MKLFYFAIVICVASVCSQADLIAYWNFNGVAPGGQTDVNSVSAFSANDGLSIATATFAGTGGGGRILYSTDDATTVNALNGDVAGHGIRIRDKVFGNDGVFTMSGLNLSGHEDVIITFGHNTLGSLVNSFAVDYNLNAGGGWVEAIGRTGYSTGGSTVVEPVDLSAISSIEGQSNVSLRFSAIGTGTGGSDVTFDNLQINATAIPEPSSLAMVALSLVLGLGIIRRRIS